MLKGGTPAARQAVARRCARALLLRPPAPGRRQTFICSLASAQVTSVKETGTFTVRGTVRKVNEDRFDVSLMDEGRPAGSPVAFAGVYDGHGGSAAAEWLKDNLYPVIEGSWSAARPEAAITEAFLSADKVLLSARTGFLGMGERGVGGSKCGATAATALLYRGANGGTRMLAANIGDARTLLIRGGKAIDVSEEHVPDK
jgi:protein phosphatase 1L